MPILTISPILRPPDPVDRGRRFASWLAAILLVALGAIWLSLSILTTFHVDRGTDIRRQWLVCQYILHGVNPYQVTLDGLHAHFGPIGSIDFRETKIFTVPITPAWKLDRHDLQAEVTMEATYPPSVMGLFLITVGFLPKWCVIPAWLLVNLVAIAFCTRRFAQRIAGDNPPAATTLLATLGLCLLWAPTQDTVVSGQFSLVALACLLTLLERSDQDDFWLGVLLSLAFVKLALALPFLAVPLIRRRWRVLATVAAVHGASTLAVSALLHTPPWELVRQWMETSKYFMNLGMYTLSDLLMKLGMINGKTDSLLSLLFLAAGLALVWACRRAGRDAITSFLIMLGLEWTYHGLYDFVFLLWFFVLASSRSLRIHHFVSFVLIDAAMSAPSFFEESPSLRALRWSCRLLLAALLIEAGILLWLDGRPNSHLDGPERGEVDLGEESPIPIKGA